MKLSFQPVHPMLQFHESPFSSRKLSATVYVINDLHREFRDASLHWEIISEEGNRVAEGNFSPFSLPADCVKKVGKIEWRLASGRYRINLQLKNININSSPNTYKFHVK